MTPTPVQDQSTIRDLYRRARTDNLALGRRIFDLERELDEARTRADRQEALYRAVLARNVVLRRQVDSQMRAA